MLHQQLLDTIQNCETVCEYTQNSILQHNRTRVSA